MRLIILTIMTIICLDLITAKSQDNFVITVQRQNNTQACTMGYLLINDKVLSYTLELPWVDNLNNISCIPKGKYEGLLRYDKSDRWRIQLDNVPNRTAVQLHIGNYTRDIQGCILIGEFADVANCSVQRSTQSYTKLKNAFYGSTDPNSSPNKKIIVIFK